MGDENLSEIDVLEGLRSVLGIECIDCKEINPSNAKICENCGAILNVREEEEESISYIENIGYGGLFKETGKIPMNKASYLITLKSVLKRAKSKNISLDEYHSLVLPILTKVRIGVELFKTDVFKKKISKLPEKEAFLARKTSKFLVEYYKGCLRMMEYDGNALEPVKEGFLKVEKSLIELDKIQDKALEIASEKKMSS